MGSGYRTSYQLTLHLQSRLQHHGATHLRAQSMKHPIRMKLKFDSALQLDTNLSDDEEDEHVIVDLTLQFHKQEETCTIIPSYHTQKIQRAIVEKAIMPNYTTTSTQDSPFNNWTPLIGVYIAGATFICVIAIVVDLIEGLQRRQYWIPSSWSSLNAASITVLTAASKLSLDLTTSMPRQIDQLSKLSTSAFVCIALANVAPSIGKLENSEFYSNIAALSFFILSSVVGLCIQLKTGVIFTFKTAHITIVVMTVILLVKCVASITFISVRKIIFQYKYDAQHQEALKDVKDRKHPTTDKLKQYLERFSMMAHSGCPHFQLAWYLPGAINTVCGLVAAMALFTILIACMTHKDKFLGPTSRNGTSNYDWSVLYILISQTIGVGVGTIVLCIRGSYIVAVQSRYRAGSTLSREQNTAAPEKYWNQGTRLDFYPLLPYIEYRQQKCLGHLLKYRFYTAGLLFFKIILLIVGRIFLLVTRYLFRKCILSVMPACPHRDEHDHVLKEFRPYFLLMDGPQFDRMAEVIMKSILFVSKKCLDAEERETKHLTELLRECCSDGFEGAVKFQIPPSEDKEDNRESPPNCWVLSVLTLAWIATALPNIDSDLKDKLKKSVEEGLVYVKLIEDNFNNKHEFANFRATASLLWYALDGNIMRFSVCWAPKDRFGHKTAKQTLVSIEKFSTTFLRRKKNSWAHVGAHYMIGACKMIMQDCENDPDDSTLIFHKLRCTISDILGACLTNLKTYILLECERSSSIEKRIEDACKILKLFGETEEIMKFLENKQIPDHLTPEEMVIMDNWRQSQSQSQSPHHGPTALV